jgi:hypothetical protein
VEVVESRWKLLIPGKTVTARGPGARAQALKTTLNVKNDFTGR